MTTTIRPARAADGETIRAVQRQAGERFRDVGMDDIADHDPNPIEELAAYAAAGRSWVAVDAADRPVGHVIVDVVDGNAHVEELSVHPDHQGTGVGRALLAQVDRWAIERTAPFLTLTTFTEVPWNRPLYEHLGFEVLTGTAIGRELRALVLVEAGHGLDPSTRVCMGRPVSEPTPTPPPSA